MSTPSSTYSARRSRRRAGAERRDDVLATEGGAGVQRGLFRLARPYISQPTNRAATPCGARTPWRAGAFAQLFVHAGHGLARARLRDGLRSERVDSRVNLIRVDLHMTITWATRTLRHVQLALQATRSGVRRRARRQPPLPGVRTERSQMDYCSRCCRHLNGALVCPGCGAYAPDIAPPAQRPHNEAAATATTRETCDSAELPALEPHSTGSSGSDEQAVHAVQGRAARRRQMVRWKKSRRRAAVATAFALVGGGLSVSALSSGSSNTETEAASAQDVSPQTETPTDAPDSSYARPDDGGSRHSGTHRATPSSPQRQTTVATASPSPTVTTSPPRHTAATSQATATATPTPPPTTAVTHKTYGHNTSPTASQTSAPTPTNSPGTDTSTASPTSTTSSPAEVCLLIVCVG